MFGRKGKPMSDEGPHNEDVMIKVVPEPEPMPELHYKPDGNIRINYYQYPYGAMPYDEHADPDAWEKPFSETVYFAEDDFRAWKWEEKNGVKLLILIYSGHRAEIPADNVLSVQVTQNSTYWLDRLMEYKQAFRAWREEHYPTKPGEAPSKDSPRPKYAHFVDYPTFEHRPPVRPF